MSITIANTQIQSMQNQNSLYLRFGCFIENKTALTFERQRSTEYGWQDSVYGWSDKYAYSFSARLSGKCGLDHLWRCTNVLHRIFSSL